MKKIDPHGAALDLLHDERDLLEAALQALKPRIRRLNQLRQSNDALGLAAATWLFGGNMSELTKDKNEMCRRLNSIEETRKLLKEDRAEQQEDAWEDEQARLASERNMPNKPHLSCGCW